MRRVLGIRLLAVLSTVLVLGLGAFQLRELLVHYDDGDYPLEHGGTITVDAGAGVRVALDLTGGESGVSVHSRTLLGRSNVVVTGPGQIVARCEAPTPISRCAVWLTVFAGGARPKIVITKRPGATVTGLTTAPGVSVIAADAP